MPIFTLERVSDPDIEPVTLAEMKQHLREFDSVTDMDTAIEGLITAGREWLEGFTGRCMVDQTWRLTVERDEMTYRHKSHLLACSFQFHKIHELLLRRTPVLEVLSASSIDSAGSVTIIDPSIYSLRLADSKYPKIVGLNGANWNYDVLQVEFRAGYADRTGSPQQDASAVPERYKQAIKLWVEANFDLDTDRMELLIKTAENIVARDKADLSLA